jgi:hypothetical protein
MKAWCYERAFLSGCLVLFFCARGGLLVELVKVCGALHLSPAEPLDVFAGALTD